MNELCTSPAESARKAQATVLSALEHGVSQAAIATAIGVSEATASRIKNNDMAPVLAFLYAAGFKVVPQSAVTVDAERLELVLTAAHTTLADMDSLRAFVMEQTS